MEEEPSAKHQCGEMSDQSSKVDDVKVPGEKLDYTTTLKKVDLHGKETLEVVCTSNPDKANEMISRLWGRAGGLSPKFISVDVEYIRQDEPPQRAAVMQLCMEELYLVYHITAATKWPKCLNDLLKEEKLFAFAGFSIRGDKEKLKMSGLDINPNKYIDIQCKWGVPYTEKKYDTLADVAACIIDPFYKDRKKNIDREEEPKLWGISPLLEKLIKYAMIDAYATYESWKKIDNIRAGLERSKEEVEDPYFHYYYVG